MSAVTEVELRRQLADCHRMMVMAELLDYSGHVSARVPGSSRVLILPRDASCAAVTPEEVELLKPSFTRNTYRVGKTWQHYREKAKRAGYL